MANKKDKKALPIGKEQINAAMETLKKYKSGKASLENRVIANEKWYRLRQWDEMASNKKEGVAPVEPTSAWLFNCIANKHADAMDNYPVANVLPRAGDDKEEAKRLSSIIPVIFAQNDFEKVYSEAWDDKLNSGTGVYGVFWDTSKLNGLGDIAIKHIDVLNLFWEPGVNDIQNSRNVFHCELVDNELLYERYPETRENLGDADFTVEKYAYEDAADTSNKSVVVDWYYRKVVDGRQVLHYCKFVNDIVLFATENDTEATIDDTGAVIREPMATRGFYDHCKYPFVFDRLFRLKGTPCGFGYIDIGKSPQEYIDRLDKCLLENALVNSSPRYFVNENGSVSEDEFRDMTNPFIHYNGQPDGIVPITGTGLSSIYVNILSSKVDELKETTGNRDISTGGSTAGVTAASAIAAMQEAGSKLSRDAAKQSYRAYTEIAYLVLELVRQFYTLPRQFRITGENGSDEYINYDNSGIAPQEQGSAFGVEMGYRMPQFDIEITAQKQSPYSKMSQNELALQFYGAGFFNPQMADQALACLDMMDFDRKQFVIDKIQTNYTLAAQLQNVQQQLVALAQAVNPDLAQQILGQQMAQGESPIPNEVPEAKDPEAESSVTANARQRTAEMTSPT